MSATDSGAAIARVIETLATLFDEVTSITCPQNVDYIDVDAYDEAVALTKKATKQAKQAYEVAFGQSYASMTRQSEQGGDTK